MRKKVVYVLLSSYNGEKYINEQINSIFNQRDIQVELFVRDDGSSDTTISKLDEIARNNDRLHIIRGENIGVKYSFLTLLQEVPDDADYYAFSDQDDYWLPDKMINAVRKIEDEATKDIPVLYASNTCLVDNELKRLDASGSYNVRRPYDFGEILIRNCASGCTMVMNKSLRSMISKRNVQTLNKFPLHDHWIYMVCLAVGGQIVFDRDSYILYRQHESNVVGGRVGLYDRIKNSPLFRGGNTRYQWSCQLLDQYGEDMPKDNRDLLLKIANYKKNAWTALSLALDHRLRSTSFAENVVVFFTILRKRF